MTENTCIFTILFFLSEFSIALLFAVWINLCWKVEVSLVFLYDNVWFCWQKNWINFDSTVWFIESCLPVDVFFIDYKLLIYCLIYNSKLLRVASYCSFYTLSLSYWYFCMMVAFVFYSLLQMIVQLWVSD